MGPAAFPSLLFFFLFLPQGVILPFLPLWLSAKGLSIESIGLLYAANYALKSVVNPVVGYGADVVLGPRRTLILILAATGALYLFLDLAGTNAAAIAILVLAIGIVQPGAYPICEQIAAATGHRHGIQYGRLRLWGSVAFAIGSLAAGSLISLIGVENTNLWIAFGFGLALFVVTTFGSGSAQRVPPQLASEPLSLNWPLVAAIAIGCLIQGSNAFMYGFGGIYWSAMGLSGTEIGVLWAVGIVSEIAFLALAGQLTRHNSIWILFAATGMCTAVRWIIFATTSSYGVMLAAQILQGFTIGLNNIAWVAYVNARVSQGRRSFVFGLYGALANGVVLGAGVYLSGRLYAATGLNGFYLMAAMAAGASLIAVVLTCTRQAVSAEARS